MQWLHLFLDLQFPFLQVVFLCGKTKKALRNEVLFSWRGRRDLNPRAGFPTYSLSRGAPSPLGYFRILSSKGGTAVKCSAPCIIRWRRGWDSNPRFLSESLVFKTSSLNRSDTSPLDCIKQLYYYTIKNRFCQEKTANFFGQFQKVLFSMEKEKNPGKS